MSGAFYYLLSGSEAETAYYSGHHQNKRGIPISFNQRSMLRRLSLGLMASAISLAAIPAIAEEDGRAEEIGLMSISLKDVIKPTLGVQGALQGAGTILLNSSLISKRESREDSRKHIHTHK